MQACQWSNQKVGRNLDIFGIVTNGEGWKFYQLSTDLQVYETLLYSISELENILGQLHYIFQCCELQLKTEPTHPSTQRPFRSSTDALS